MQGTNRLRQAELKLRLLEDHIREQTNHKFGTDTLYDHTLFMSL